MAQQDDTSKYLLSRDYTEINRLNLQHFLWTRLFGYLVHPAIATDKANLRVADVGSGTGIWADEVANNLPPGTTVENLDISFGAGGPAEALPKNIKQQYFDVTDPDVAPELVAAYDVVHIRAFAFVLQQNQLPLVTRNLYKILKPGGRIQWGDIDVASFRIEKLRDDLDTQAMVNLLKLTQSTDQRLDPQWVPLLPKYLSDAGFVDTVADVKEAPPYLGLAKHNCSLSLHEMIALRAGKAYVADEIRKIMAEVSEEAQRGAYMAFTRHTVIGRKPEM